MSTIKLLNKHFNSWEEGLSIHDEIRSAIDGLPISWEGSLHVRLYYTLQPTAIELIEKAISAFPFRCNEATIIDNLMRKLRSQV
jgi:hypothetical protein